MKNEGDSGFSSSISMELNVGPHRLP